MLQSIRVEGLFGDSDISIDFSNGPVFLVGPNGSGKTTVIKIVHSILTGQWTELFKLNFRSLHFLLNNKKFDVEKEYCELLSAVTNAYRSVSDRRTPGQSLSLGVFPNTYEEFIKKRLIRISAQTKLKTILSSDEISRYYPEARKLVSAIESEVRESVLYFPTYRRVERELSELVDEVDFEDMYASPHGLNPIIRERFSKFGEVVGFGGQDISQLIAAAAKKVSLATSVALNEHSVRFIDSLMRSEKMTVKSMRQELAAEGYAFTIIDRLEGLAVPGTSFEEVKTELIHLKNKVQIGGQGRLTQKEDMLLYYLSSLRDLFTEIDTNAAYLREFAQTADRYLSPRKKVKFDSVSNLVSVFSSGNDEVPFEDLSSGEKQIIAFFAFITISENRRNKFLIVDEPELSLSVDWQTSLIDDMVKLSSCKHVLVATHSPFIFERFGLQSVVEIGC